MVKRGSVWLGMAILWAGYAAVFTGYVWLRGYNIPFGQIVGPMHFYNGPWPPPQSIPSGNVFPAAGQSGG